MADPPSAERAGEIKVWDLFVRIFHWTVVTGFFIAYFTEDDVLTLHVWAGYTIGGLVVLRILWGLVGPRHARFTDFIYGPSTVRKYLFDLLALRAKRYIGHSPAGGAMVVALLVMLLATGWAGLETYAIRNNAGPLAALRAETAAPAVVLPVSEDEGRRGRRRGGVWKEIHEVLANLTLALVILHIVGVGWASLAHRENLVRAMITGRKRSQE